MTTHEFDSTELRRIIFGEDVFRKCPACDNEGREYWDENGCPARPSTLPEWGDNYQDGDCEDCNGLGYNLFPANNPTPTPNNQ